MVISQSPVKPTSDNLSKLRHILIVIFFLNSYTVECKKWTVTKKKEKYIFTSLKKILYLDAYS